MEMVGRVIAVVATLLLILIVGGIFSGTPAHAQGQGGIGNITAGGNSGGITNPLGSKDQTITDVLVKVINWMLGLVGFIALIALITGGARMIMDFGSEDQVKKGKTTILWAVIGLLVVILSYAIINIVTSEILGAPSSSTYQQ